MDEITNNEKQFVTLEQAITEGADALIPYEFKYPSTDLIVEVKIRPVTSTEFQSIGQIAKVHPETNVDLELLKIALFNVDGSHFEDEILEKLPAGVVLDLGFKIADISGIDLNKIPKVVSSDSLPGF